MKANAIPRQHRSRATGSTNRLLLAALTSNRIQGAGLDAFHQEPLPADHPLWSMPNVLISPHTAAFAYEYWAPVVDVFLDNVERFRRGVPLRNVVDKSLGY
jgi:phosphoglycerate dehydrogenase-like enzyme